MTERLLTVRGLSAGYAGVPVVRDVDLHVDAGEVVGLLGPNGAGKTTTLLSISGLVPALDGSIDVLGEPVETKHPFRNARRSLAHVPENRSLFFDLTVRENLRLGGQGPKGDRNAAIEEALELMPALQPLQDRRAGLLSGGEQQMLALARALASRPRLVLIDEMSLGLAPIIVEQLLPIVRRVADEQGAGVLLVEQHVHMALTVADRAVVLSHGQVVLDESAEALRADPSVLESSYLGGA